MAFNAQSGSSGITLKGNSIYNWGPQRFNSSTRLNHGAGNTAASPSTIDVSQYAVLRFTPVAGEDNYLLSGEGGTDSRHVTVVNAASTTPLNLYGKVAGAANAVAAQTCINGLYDNLSTAWLFDTN